MDNKSDSDEGEPQSRKEDCERISTYFNTPSDEDYCRGKRERKQSTSFYFLQTQFKDMTTEDQSDFPHHAWIEYQVSGKTNLLERYTSGFIFAQLSTKQGINKYRREAKLQLLAEFKQLVEYRTFHHQKSEDFTYEHKKKATNMITSSNKRSTEDIPPRTQS